MLTEVRSGTKPGRPRLLLLVSAGLLAGTLGLAWLQVRNARALGPEQRVGDTPLWVRPPLGWRRHPQNPKAFILPARTEGRRRPRHRVERSLRLEFRRLRGFESVEQLLPLLGLGEAPTRASLRRARLGKYEAVEVHVLPVFAGRRLRQRGMIVRFTCLPRGHLIKVAYQSLDTLRPADLEIMEDVCRTLRVDEPTLSGRSEEYLSRAGLTLDLQKNWHVVGSDLPGVPAVHIGGSVNERPAWSIAIFRTWLAGKRRPSALLEDFAAEQWLLWDVERLIRTTRRADGATIAALRHPEAGRADKLMIPSAWVVAQTSSRAVIMFVYAGPGQATLADDAAGRIAESLEITPLEALSGLAEAEQAGRTLAGKLAKRGPVPRWGRESVQTRYEGRSLEGREMLLTQRRAIDRDPDRGYSGALLRQVGTREELRQWTVDGRAAEYDWQADFLYVLYGRALELSVREQRRQGAGEVVRRVFVNGRQRQEGSLRPGPGFVAPPTESIVEGWVARNEASVAIIEVSTRLGTGTHTVLLRHLPPDGNYPRLLGQQDYWPVGWIAAYDDARAEVQYEIRPTAKYERVE